MRFSPWVTRRSTLLREKVEYLNTEGQFFTQRLQELKSYLVFTRHISFMVQIKMKGDLLNTRRAFSCNLKSIVPYKNQRRKNIIFQREIFKLFEIHFLY